MRQNQQEVATTYFLKGGARNEPLEPKESCSCQKGLWARGVNTAWSFPVSCLCLPLAKPNWNSQDRGRQCSPERPVFLDREQGKGCKVHVEGQAGNIQHHCQTALFFLILHCDFQPIFRGNWTRFESFSIWSKGESFFFFFVSKTRNNRLIGVQLNPGNTWVFHLHLR